jgi:hypothetical protein
MMSKHSIETVAVDEPAVEPSVEETVAEPDGQTLTCARCETERRRRNMAFCSTCTAWFCSGECFTGHPAGDA